MKGDDVEIGVRIYNEKFISMNSICVWHEDFFKKFTPLYTNFYETRNLLIINALIFEKYSFLKAYILIVKRILRELIFFRYDGCSLIFQAVDEFFKGSKYIQSKDNETFVINNSKYYKMKHFSDLKNEVKNISKIFDINKKSEEKKMNNFFRILTFNGQFLPKFLLKNQVEVPIVIATFRSVENSKKIFHFDIENEKGYVTKLNKIKLLLNFSKLFFYFFIFLFKFNSLKNDYVKTRLEMTSIDSWEKQFR